MNRRGILKVTLFVFCLLLGLMFIGIIGGYFLDALHQGGAGLQGAAACTLVQIYPMSCSYTKMQSGEFILTVQGKYEGSNVEISSLHVLLKDSKKDVVRKGANTLPKHLETTEVYREKDLPLREYSFVSFVPTILLNDGRTATCEPSREIECV